MITTRDELHAAIDALEAVTADDEMAHSEEDRIHREVLEGIANGAPNPAGLAALALKTRELDFSRWCA